MKFKSILILSFLALVIFSCKEDENSPMDNGMDSSLFVGIWKINQEFVNDQEQTIPECELQANYVFNADGSATEYIYEGQSLNSCDEYSDNGTWAIKSETSITFNITGGEPEDEIVFVLDNNKLTAILLEAGNTYKDIYTK